MVEIKGTSNSSIHSLGSEWQLLAEFVVTAEPDQKLRAIEQVAETVGTFRLSAQPMAQLKMAITRAVMNKVGQSNHADFQQPGLIRVMASMQAVDLRANPEKYGASGWGFFLIEKMTQGAWQGGETSCHMVELFLYLEGEIQNKQEE